MQTIRGRDSTRIPKKYAAVLILSWDESIDDINTSLEVEALGKLFEEKFRYTVVRRKLKNLTKERLRLEIQRHLENFFYDYDDYFTLLLVYYIGHATRGKPGELHLAGRINDKDFTDHPAHPARNSFPWHPNYITMKLLDSTKADVLLILDCCYAGNLAPAIQGKGQIPPNFGFEYLAACFCDEVTQPPGPKSFTTALIWAVNDLLRTRGRFSIHELQQKIMQAPDFPRDQVVQTREHGQLYTQRLVLEPLAHPSNSDRSDIYGPLEDGEIRLLALQKSLSEDASIECDLYCCKLDNPPRYEALSYIRGDPDITREITLQGSTIRVTESLYNALRRLRQRQTDRILWIDAICIDQSNNAERSRQISHKSDIYAKAKSVVIYLGEATETTDRIMDYLIQIDESETSQISPTFKLSEISDKKDGLILEGFRDILSRPFFQRSRLLQEVSTAPAAVLYCGSKAVSLKTIVRASELLPTEISLQVLGLMSVFTRGSRSTTEDDEMDERLLRAIGQKRSASPAPSEASSVFSDLSMPSTHTSYPPEDVEISVLHLVELLLTQDSFANLCQRGFHREDLEPARFANNLRRMLKTFGKTLLSEGQSYSAQLTAQLILGDSRRMAALIRARYDPSYERIGSKLISSNLDSMPETERQSRIENFVQQLDSANVIDDNSDSGDDPDQALNEEPTGSFSIDEINNFIPSSRAFQNMLESLKFFLKLSRLQDVSPSVATLNHPQPQSIVEVPLENVLKEQGSVPQELTERSYIEFPNLELPKDYFCSRLYERLSNWLIKIERPKEGLQRIQYTCSCGEPMFVDIKELKPGGLDRLQRQLATSLAGPQGQIMAGFSGMSAVFPTIPQRAYATGGSSGGVSNSPTIPDQVGPRESHGDVGIELGPQQSVQADDIDTIPRYLLLCINTRNLTQLLHVDLRYIGNDQVLFDSIRRRYWEARRRNSWHYGLLTPRWLTDRMPAAWRDWLESLHLRVPRSAELIQFRLVPFHTSICPDKIRLGLPPEDQVKVKKNYHYDPCPADVEVLSIPKFSHLLKPGFHTHNFWLNTFPKKLRMELAYKPAVIGWGLIIDEGWDWVILLSSMLGLMIIVGITVVLYAIFTHDPASAVGIGAYAVALITFLFTLKYWAWQEHESS